MKELREIGIGFTKYEKSNYPNNLGKRSKFGGNPEWIQSDETPICPYCKNQMSFVCQIDSFDYDLEYSKQEYIFGDIGMIYVFFCFKCNNSKSVFQSY